MGGFELGPVPWRQAMATALYGPGGFYTTAAPKEHFRTSALAPGPIAAALMRIVVLADAELGRPDPLMVVDVGAGRGELLRRLSAVATPELDRRLRLCAVERAPRPDDLAATIGWSDRLPMPRSVTGVVIATEWLDNVPLDIAEVDDDGTARYVVVDPQSGTETLGEPIEASDAGWAARWYGDAWPTGARLELGMPRDTAWADAVGTLRRGLAVTVDYGHTRQSRPRGGTLAAFRGGREVAPIPDGSCDITAHVAIDAVQAAGEAVAGAAAQLATQRTVLTGLGVDAGRPPLALAHSDPIGYSRALAAATEAAELVAPAGLGGHYWLLQPVGVSWHAQFG